MYTGDTHRHAPPQAGLSPTLVFIFYFLADRAIEYQMDPRRCPTIQHVLWDFPLAQADDMSDVSYKLRGLSRVNAPTTRYDAGWISEGVASEAGVSQTVSGRVRHAAAEAVGQRGSEADTTRPGRPEVDACRRQAVTQQ